MDAFFAAVEQRDSAQLQGKPVAVGWEMSRSVVCAASYEARKYGVRSAMPAKLARKKCPQLIFVKPRFSVYQDVSRQIRRIFERYTDLIEPLSLDEAYLDVTEPKTDHSSATDIAEQIKADIWQEMRLTASAGVSYCKFLAKIASDINKPNGIYIIRPHQARGFLDQLPIAKFYGVGRKTAAKMNSMGIFNGADLHRRNLEELQSKFGKAGTFYYNVVRGIDERPVVSHRIAKSIGTETTFASDLTDEQELLTEIEYLAKELLHDVQQKSIKAKTLTLKIKYHDFVISTRSKTYPFFIDEQTLTRCGAELLLQAPLPKAIRLLGLQLSNFQYEDMLLNNNLQLSLDFA